MGGVICGNCAIGRFCRETRPTTTMMMDRTEAKMGRSIKKWGLMTPSSFYFAPRCYLRKPASPDIGWRLPEFPAEFDEILPRPPGLRNGDRFRSATRSRATCWREPAEAPLYSPHQSHRQMIPWVPVERLVAG